MIKNRSEGIIALGGNLPFGNGSPESESDEFRISERQYQPEATFVHAIASMAAEGLTIRAVSRFFRTPCFPAGAGPDYVNAAVRFSSNLSAPDVLTILHRVENKFGRQRLQRWGMRTLDLDLIALGDQVLPDTAAYEEWRALPPDSQVKAVPDRLILPHPRLQDRGFVLVPVADIAPDWVHPVLKRSIRSLLADLSREEIAEIRPL